MHTYEEAIEWIHGRLRGGIKPGLSRMEAMMERLGHPERRIRAVHIGGTNGKGSTTAMLRSILTEAGFETGTFTSPYIEQFNERISVNGKPISDEDMLLIARKVKEVADAMDAAGQPPSEFEIVTAMALYYFGYVHPVDIALFEVGLGGRLDSTNVLHPVLCVITTIGMDHMQFLGNTLEAIAAEKAGIIKSGVPVITAVHQPEAKAVIAEQAKAHRAALYSFGQDFTGVWTASCDKAGERFDYASPYGERTGLETGLSGFHQVQNGAVAVMAAEYLRVFLSFPIEEEHIQNGLKKAVWPGRFDTLSKEPLIIADGAHNEEGIAALMKTTRHRLANKRVTILFSAMKDKPLGQMVELLKEGADELLFTTFAFPRAASEKEFAPFLDGTGRFVPDSLAAVDAWKKTAGPHDVLLITGSLYFISFVKQHQSAHSG